MLIAAVSILQAKKVDAGQYSHLVAIVVATDDGQQVVVPVDPVSLKAMPPLINKGLVRQVSTTTQTVCGPDGCETVTTAAPADCPCSCPDCTCAPAAAATTTRSTVVTKSVYHASGPVRGAFRRLGAFVVKGGPIRQALRANRQARRGG